MNLKMIGALIVIIAASAAAWNFLFNPSKALGETAIDIPEISDAA